MSDGADWIFVVDAQIDADAEAAWNDWYTNDHLPAILTCPGFLSGQRFRVDTDASRPLWDEVDRHPRQYIAYYRITGPEVFETPEFKETAGWGGFDAHVTFRSRVLRAVSSQVLPG